MPSAARLSTEDHSADDELERAFPGCVLTHVLNVTARDPLSLGIEALQAVRAQGWRLDGLNVQRCGDAYESRIRLGGLRPQEARRLATQLAGLPGVDRVAVEHQILKT